MGTPKAAGAVLVFYAALVSVVSSVYGISDPSEVNALSTMFNDFNQNPRLTGWTQNNGDPCGAAWYGISCLPDNFITSIKIPGLMLNGKLEGWVLQNLEHLQVVDVSNNNITGEIPQQFPNNITEITMNNNLFTGSLPQLDQLSLVQIINLSNNELTGNINPQIFTALTNLITLDLSFNQLQGTLPDTVKNMVALQTLNLQNNQLSGQLPPTLSQLNNLQTFNIENNQFTGSLPAGFNPRTYKYGGNQLQAPSSSPGTPSTPQSTPATTKASGGGSSIKAWFTSTTHIIEVAAGGAALVLVLFSAFLFFCVIRKRRHPAKALDDQEAHHSSRRMQFPQSPVKEPVTSKRIFEAAPVDKGTIDEPKTETMKTLKAPPSFKGVMGVMNPKASTTSKAVNKSSIAVTAFSVADLQAATNSFSQENLIGEGSMGRVYRAEFANGQVLAVKKIDSFNASQVENEDDFLSVVQGLARLQHANAVELVGYCVEHDQRLLVYEYIGRGNLHELLHYSGDNFKGLTWNVRIKIALGSARALEYMHEVCAPPVVHRSFKSANILLDDELNPHVSDCGLAALSPSGSEREVSAQMLGSFGYSAPEYAMSGTYTVKSDVYSFGVVMLELLTGRKPLDSSRPRSEQSLVRWATPQLHDIDALARMVDPALKGKYPAKSLSRLADIVALCVQPEPEFRPPMSEVVQSLVRLMQRATLSKRSSDSGGAGMESIEPSENSI
uniref:Leucine-rich repeat receptor-like protein kinase n=1 Tax=Pohlia nutans TaxID=140635 RepID=A0A1P8DYY8_9BRYO|nr:leucine-rich repeat receptor-like protein kinase [Pohlia nutans]